MLCFVTLRQGFCGVMLRHVVLCTAVLIHAMSCQLAVLLGADRAHNFGNF